MVWAVDNAAEYVTLVQSNATFCDLPMSPLVTNGFQLTVSTNAGNDTFFNSVTPNVRIYAGAGDDILINYPSTSGFSITAGGPGSDNVIADANDFIITEQGDDFICVSNGTANTVDGGSGTDALCGSAVNETSIVHRCPCRQVF